MIKAKGDQTIQGVSKEHSLSYAIEKQRRIVQVSIGKKITDFRLIIEVVDCGAQPEMNFARSLIHGLGATAVVVDSDHSHS